MKMLLKKQKPWEGSQIAELRINIPCQSLMLCRILEVDPEKLIRNFLATLGAESYGMQGQARQLIEEYFIWCGYGQQHYTEEDIRKMIEELKSIGTLWPQDAPMKVIDKHSSWRKMYNKYWYHKWYYKQRRKK